MQQVVALALLAIAAVAHEGEERVGVDRLGEIVRDAEAGRLLARVPYARADDDPDRRHLRVLDLRRPELPPVHPRHHEVEEDETGRLRLLEPVERLAAVVGELDDVALALEEPAERVLHLRVVLDDQDAVAVGHRRFRSAFARREQSRPRPGTAPASVGAENPYGRIGFTLDSRTCSEEFRARDDVAR